MKYPPFYTNGLLFLEQMPCRPLKVNQLSGGTYPVSGIKEYAKQAEHYFRAKWVGGTTSKNVSFMEITMMWYEQANYIIIYYANPDIGLNLPWNEVE
jgi:hypothetical protein